MKGSKQTTVAKARMSEKGAYTKLIILGAGKPHTGDTPSAVRMATGNVRVLEWLLAAFNSHIDERPTFVAGYHADEVKKHFADLLTVIENAAWQETGSVGSLFCVSLTDVDTAIVSYSDVLFRAELVDTALQGEAPIAIGYDSAWRRRYTVRSESDLERCEKVIVRNGSVLRCGADMPVDWATGEFAGFAVFRDKAMEELKRLQKHNNAALAKMNLTGLIEYVRAKGYDTHAVDLNGHWAEVRDTRDIARFVLGTKAETLSRLRDLVQRSEIQDQISFTVKEWTDSAGDIIRRARKRFGDSLLVVRSSALSEDSFSSANAGAYTSVLNVEPNNGLSEAIERVINSYMHAASDDQVLVQPMLTDVVMSGVAFTRTLERGAPWYVINYSTDGGTEGVTSGSSADHKTLFVRRGLQSEDRLDVRSLTVLTAIREIEDLLDYDYLDIEFAVDSSGIVHVLQVRPVAANSSAESTQTVTDADIEQAIEEAGRTWDRLAGGPPHLAGGRAMYGVMPDWNPAEIIGTCPGAMAESLYRYLIMNEVWATQRAEYGYRDVRPQPLLVNFGGRPYVDVRASFTSFVPACVPEKLAGRLVDFYLEWLRANPNSHDKVEFDVVPTCIAPGFEQWERRLSDSGRFSTSEIERLREGLLGITKGAFYRCSQDLAQIDQLEQRFQTVDSADGIDPLERARILLEDCRCYGTLPFSHLARSGFVAVTLLRRAVETGVITNTARESFLSTVRTVSHTLTEDARSTASGSMSWNEFVSKYGHLRPGTYDIVSFRYDADPERFLRPLVEHAREAEVEAENSGPWEREKSRFFAALHELELPSDEKLVESFMRDAIQGREYAKFVFSRNLSSALEALAELGNDLGLTREEMAELPLESIIALRDTRYVAGKRGSQLQSILKSSKQWRAVALASELPPLVTDRADFDAFEISADTPNFVGSKSVSAPAIDLARQSLAITPENNSSAVTGAIVLTPQADPGYDWLFGQGIAGLITLYGGANSHMAIRAAEFGLSAAIGVGEQRYRELSKGRMIELDPVAKTLRAIG